MPRINAANDAKTNISSAIDHIQTTFDVVDSSAFPNVPFRVVIEHEIMEVTNVSGNTWTVLRGLEGTTAESHNENTEISNRWTAGTYEELAGQQDLENKVDKVAGKQLSTEDYTTAEKTKLSNIEAGAEVNTVDSVNGKTGDVNITKSDVGLAHVDNVQQASKTEFDAHKAENATSTQLGHVKVGQNLAIDSDGTLHAQASGGKKVARFVIGTSIAGWSSGEVDYLCDGTDDQVEINNAIGNLPTDGGEIVILDGTYNIGAIINVDKDNVKIRGNGDATILKRMWDSDGGAEGVITLNSVSNCKIKNLQIDGNKATYTFSNNRGIYLSSSSNNTVTGNTCNDNGSGIYLYSNSSNNTVTGNTCNNNKSSGIYLLSSSNNNTITGNICNSNDDGISLSSSNNNTITGNICNNNSSYDIYLSSSNNNTITGNTCNNSNYGIRLFSSSSDNTVTGNTCNSNNDDGISLFFSSNNTITGNTCNNNSYGIRLYSSCDDNVVVGNNTSGSSTGVDDSGSGNVVANNKT